MAGKRLDGLAVGSIAAGGLLTFAGIKGYSVPQTLQLLISGKSPAAQSQVTPISGAAVSGSSGGGTASGQAIASTASQYEGHCYRFGGVPHKDGSGCWDCSSFSNYCLWRNGLAVPGGIYDPETHGPNTLIYAAWSGAVTIGHKGSVARAGDLAVWQTHMGICLGPDSMISAQTPATGTRKSGIDGFMPGELLSIRRIKAVA